MKSYIPLLVFISMTAGCQSHTEISTSHNSAESLLRAYVLVQSRPLQIKRLCYSPATIETFGQDWDEFIQSTAMSHLTVKDSVLEEFTGNDQPMTEMSHNGLLARAFPVPIGYLRVNFENQDGVTDRYVRVQYGEHAGKYYICTWQKAKPAG